MSRGCRPHSTQSAPQRHTKGPALQRCPVLGVQPPHREEAQPQPLCVAVPAALYDSKVSASPRWSASLEGLARALLGMQRNRYGLTEMARLLIEARADVRAPLASVLQCNAGQFSAVFSLLFLFFPTSTVR